MVVTQVCLLLSSILSLATCIEHWTEMARITTTGRTLMCSIGMKRAARCASISTNPKPANRVYLGLRNVSDYNTNSNDVALTHFQATFSARSEARPHRGVGQMLKTFSPSSLSKEAFVDLSNRVTSSVWSPATTDSNKVTSYANIIDPLVDPGSTFRVLHLASSICISRQEHLTQRLRCAFTSHAI